MEQEGFVDVSMLLRCAVYALLKGGEIVYIGRSKEPIRRLYSHANVRGRLNYRTQKMGFQFDAIWLWPCKLADMDALEERLIDEHQPRYNKHFKDHMKVSLDELMSLSALRYTPRPVEFDRRF